MMLALVGGWGDAQTPPTHSGVCLQVCANAYVCVCVCGCLIEALFLSVCRAFAFRVTDLTRLHSSAALIRGVLSGLVRDDKRANGTAHRKELPKPLTVCTVPGTKILLVGRRVFSQLIYHRTLPHPHKKAFSFCGHWELVGDNS